MSVTRPTLKVAFALAAFAGVFADDEFVIANPPPAMLSASATTAATSATLFLLKLFSLLRSGTASSRYDADPTPLVGGKPKTAAFGLAGHPVELGLAEEHAPGLRALVAGDDPAPFQHVDQASRARVADPQPPLEERDGGGLGLDDDLDRPLEQRVLVGVELAVLGVDVFLEGLRKLE